jgi:hypothetical protein
MRPLHAHSIVNAVRGHFAGQLRFVFRHFPLTQVHPNAEPAAVSAEFAGAHGKFWDMHDGIYENQDRLGLPVCARGGVGTRRIRSAGRLGNIGIQTQGAS